MKQGRIIPNGVILEKHEYKTILFLTELGLDVELIPKSNKQGEHSADIKISRLIWEIKSPRGSGKYLIHNTLHRAARQSENVIVDLQRIKIHQTRCLQELEKTFFDLKRLKRLRVITKARKIVDFIK